MTENAGLKQRIGELLHTAFERLLDDLQANPVASVVVLAATAISYESLYLVSYAVGHVGVLAFLFPLVLDVAAYPALTTLLSSAYRWGPRMFAGFVSLWALLASIYGNMAAHLASNYATRPELFSWARDWAWVSVPGSDGPAISSPSLPAIWFVSLTVPLAIATTLVLLRCTPKRPQPVDKAVDAPESVPEVVPVKPTPKPTPVPEVTDIHGNNTAERMRAHVRKVLRETGQYPTPAEVDTAVPNKHRNGARAIAQVKADLAKSETG
jgi:hypothetical protein